MMKGAAKRFLNHKGKAYPAAPRAPNEAADEIGFLDLWRFASAGERVRCALGALLAAGAAAALVAAVAVYGELTALFVRRSGAASAPAARLLQLFGGGAPLPAGNRTAHMEALVADSTAFALASLAVMGAHLACAAAAVTLCEGSACRMVARLRLRLLECVISQEIAFFDTNTSMNFASALTEDTEKLRRGVGEHVAMVAYLAGSAACGCALALAYGWRLTLAGAAVVPLALLVQALVAKYQTRCAEEETALYGRAGRLAQEVLSAVRTVRAYAAEQLEERRYGVALALARGAARRRAVWAGAGLGLGWLLTYSINAIVFAYGARLVVRDRELPPDRQEYDPGVMVTVLFCTFVSAQNIAMCGPHLELFSSARGAARALFRLLERAPAIGAHGEEGLKPHSFHGDVVFDDVHFSYPSRPDVPVLRGLTLTVRAGETVALVGGSGSGKSTALQLLLRLYEPRAGSLRLAGHRLRDLHPRHYRANIGVVGQEPVLFAGTVRENIALGMADASEERLVAAAELANAHHFISKLPQGYETVVGAGGAGLSGGQRQRVAIARALLREPALLLLDEPTAALDAAAERRVQAALDAAAAGRTTIVVSHRLSTIKNATRIVYLEKGVVAEQGSHEELVARRGHYWRLLQQDAAGRNVSDTDAGTPSEHAAVLSELGAASPREHEEEEPWERSPQRALSRASAPLGGVTVAAWRGSVRASLRLPAPALAVDASFPEEEAEEKVEHDQEEGEEERGAGVSWREAARLLRPVWARLAAGGLASLAIGATMPAFAFLFSKLYGMFAWPDGEEVVRAAQTYAALFLGAAALSGLLGFLQAWLFSRAGSALADRLRLRLLRAFLAQEQAWFDEPANSTGALSARLAADCAAVKAATGTTLGAVLQGVSTMALGVGLAMLYSWKMTLVSLLSVPCVVGGIYLEGWAARRSEARGRRALEQAARLATEVVQHVRTVQSLGVERALLARYAAALAAAGGARGARQVRGLVYGVGLCAPTLGYAVSLAYGGYLIAREDLPYEYAILVSEALIYGAWMMAEALSFAPSLAGARRAAARVLAALERRPALADAPGALDDPDWVCSGEVALHDVEFSYPRRSGDGGGDTRVLRGLSLRLAAGHTLALVGASGSGKSTVLQLLLRNYDAQRGRVELGGRDVRALTARAARAQVALVAQEPTLFERSLRENIAYGAAAAAAPAHAVVRAARQADIHDFIVGLPMGYETVVGAGGAGLSGGQRQRVAIARALLREPALLLLDEATSALDVASEQAVQRALATAARGRSVLTVAHRLATVRRADTIAVVHEGAVVESGAHEELVALRGRYWRLLRQQEGAGDADDAAATGAP